MNKWSSCSIAVVLAGCTSTGPSREFDTGGDATATSDAGETGSTTQVPVDLGPDTSGPSGDGDGDAPPDSGSGDGDDSGDGDGDPSARYAAPLYAAQRVHSPLTPFVADNLASIRALAPDAPADLFMKIGASSTVNTKTLHCFADGPVELGANELALGASLDFFLLGEAADTTPFDRHTLAAKVGETAGWAITGAPSPVDVERAALAPAGPSLALLHCGTNDMQQGITYASAMPAFHANMSDLLDELIDAGIVPIVFGISRRLDSQAADFWVGTYNAVSRGLAQARSIPFVDLHYALEGLEGYGISGDGIHLEALPEGACILSEAGLEHGYNVRNLIALEALDRARRTLVEDESLDAQAELLAGAGDLDAPFEIPSLPFSDTNTTLGASSIEFDVYTGCDYDADESGPEQIYRFELDGAQSIRAMVLDRADVDIDIHILDDSASEAGCLARGDRLVEMTLPPGTYYAVLDTYVDGGGEEQAGPYSFVLVACELGDVDCL